MNIHLQPQQEDRLAEAAGQRGTTKEELARQIICRYLEEDKASVDVEPAVDDRGGLGTELAALFPNHGLDFAIPELRFTIMNPFESSEAAGLHGGQPRAAVPT